MGRKAVGMTTPKLTAITALASGLTKAEAARAAGVDQRTITNWKRDPVFMDELNSAITEFNKMPTQIARIATSNAGGKLEDLATKITNLREAQLDKEREIFLDSVTFGLDLLDKCKQKWGSVSADEIDLKELPKILLAANKMIFTALDRYDAVFGDNSPIDRETVTETTINVTRKIVDPFGNDG